MHTIIAADCLGNIEMKPLTEAHSFISQSKSVKLMWQSWKPGNKTTPETGLRRQCDIHRKQNLAWRIGDEVTMSLYHDLAKVRSYEEMCISHCYFDTLCS
jgi:hypothetical protein